MMRFTSLMKPLSPLGICFGAILLSTTSLAAQSLPALGQSEDGWRHSLGIYMFAPFQTKGTSVVAGASVDVNADLSDILNVLDFALAGRYEGWNGDFGIIVDANYAGIGATSALPGPLGASADVDVRQKWLGVLAAYRVADGRYGKNNQRFTFDIQGGARYNSIKQEVKITTPGPGVPPVLGGDEGWVEPVIGARGMWRIDDKWTTIASIDLGGFGAGGNDLQIGANLGFDYQPWDSTAITFGYRYLSVDYSTVTSTGPFAYDITQHGPYVGVKFLFN